MVEPSKTIVLEIKNIKGEDLMCEITRGRTFVKGINLVHFIKKINPILPNEEFTLTISKSERE